MKDTKTIYASLSIRNKGKYISNCEKNSYIVITTQTPTW